MQYLLLIYDEENKWAELPQDQVQALMGEYNRFTAELKASGHMVGANRLQSVENATTVRVRDGKTQVTDGPFAETREQLGGYYLIEAKDLDEATRIAARIPSARLGSIEVRPIFSH
ncbi:MAG TPA: YciI family protein [Kofleriaceae bacterium]|nr:YciI family protein [Kofleriaceae bacterium]